MAQLVDHRGEPLRRRDLTREISGPTVTGTRSIWTQALTRDITPSRLASILRESEQPGEGASERYVELAEAMEERDLHYLGVISTRKRQVAQIGVVVEPASDAAEDVRDADLVRECLERDELEDELVDILDAIAKGYSVGEIVWETSAREWRPVRIEHRLPQWFDFDRDTGQRIQMRGDDAGWVDLDRWPYKFLRHIPRAKSGLPLRSGLARCAAFAWIAKTYTLRDWVQFSEIYGRPFRVGKYHRAATEAEKSVLYRAVRDLGADAAAIIPEEMMIEFMGDASGAAHSDMHRELVRYVDSQISIAVLGQTLTTQEGDSGSYALGAVHNQVRGDIERSDGRQLAATLRRDLAIPIVTLNHGPRDAYPRIVIERESPPDLALLSESLERLVPLGLRVRQDQIRTMFGLDAPDDDDEVLHAAAMPPPGATDPPPAPPARARDAGGEPQALAADLALTDPIPALTARTRETLGPLVDAWADRLGAGIEAAGSLEAARDWLDTAAVDALDTAAVSAGLGPALVAAHLAGRYDVDEDPVGADLGTARAAALESLAVALGTAAAEHTQLPFDEQIDFFRSKISLPTQTWTDLWQSQHDVAFVVAGAARDDLVSDLRGAVDQAIAEGTTLETFRRDFDEIVARHGWSYRGGRAWRTEVIYGTNLRTSYAAGRFRQLKDVARRRPYWRYRHSHASEEPRHQHLAWDGLVLRHDDGWWDTHYPPNGWGCKCYVEALNDRGLARLGKSGPDTAPALDARVVQVGREPSRQTAIVPAGIDPGWAYAPGQAEALAPAARRYLEDCARRAPGVAAAGAAATLARDSVLDALGDEWRRWRREPGGRGRQAEAFTPGAMTPDVMAWLRGRKQVEVANAAITVTRGELSHAGRASKAARGAALDDVDLDRLPAIFARPEAVLYDTVDPAVLYVFTPEGRSGKGKVVVRVNFTNRLKLDDAQRASVTTNSVRSGGYVETHNLLEPRYQRIQGDVE